MCIRDRYDIAKFNLYGMGGISTIGYTYQDHFSVDKEVVKADAITTFQVKGGGRYNLDDRLSAFANIGYVEKPPCLLYTSPSPRDRQKSRMPSSA